MAIAECAQPPRQPGEARSAGGGGGLGGALGGARDRGSRGLTSEAVIGWPGGVGGESSKAMLPSPHHGEGRRQTRHGKGMGGGAGGGVVKGDTAPGARAVETGPSPA